MTLLLLEADGMVLQCVTDFKDVLGWDQSQVTNWDAVCRHTALAALAQLRQAAIRNALCGLIRLPPQAPRQPVHRHGR